MKENKYFVYRLIFNEQTIYIGSTENVDNRLKKHSTSGIKYDKVMYTTVQNKECMLNVEYSLISKYSPVYNKRVECGRVSDMDIGMFTWETLNLKSKRAVVYYEDDGIREYTQIPKDFTLPLNILNGEALQSIPDISFSVSDRIVYAFLRGCYIEKGEFTILQEFIAEALNLSQRTVNRSINTLISAGLIVVDKGFRSYLKYKEVK